MGGFGSAILEFMVQHNYNAEIKMLGIPDKIIEHGTPKELHHECGFDAHAIAETARVLLKDKISVSSFIAG